MFRELQVIHELQNTVINTHNSIVYILSMNPGIAAQWRLAF